MFSHAFQPIVDIRSREVSSYEALLRGPNGESPGCVFSQVRKDQFVLFDQLNRETAIHLAAKLGIRCSLSLNFFPSSIIHEGGRLLHQTVDAVERAGLDVRQLVIEVTEEELIKDVESLLTVLDEIRRRNVTIAIDDFGAGYSGLTMLTNVHPDAIKIDRLLVNNIHRNGPRQSVVRAIVTVCQDLGIRIVAEGVETEMEYDFLRNTGIVHYQGYLFGKPCFEALREASFPD